MVRSLIKGLIRRGISCLLILCILVTGLNIRPVTVSAATNEPEITGFAIESPPVALSAMPAGSDIFFGGFQWILLNPSEGLLIFKNWFGMGRTIDSGMTYTNKYLNPASSTNLGYFLANDFYNVILESERARLLSRDWNVGDQSVTSQVMTGKVGLLDRNQVNLYRDILLNNLLPSGWWIANWFNVDSEGGWLAGISGNYYIDSMGNEVVETDDSLPHLVRPAVYISPNTPVQEGMVIAPQNDILSLTVPGQLGSSVIDTVNHEIYFAIPDTVDRTTLQPTITIPAGAATSPLSEASQDFTYPVGYTVTSADGFPQVWTVTCIVRSTFTGITEFTVPEIASIPDNYAAINPVNHTINFTVPEGTDVTALVPTLYTSPEGTISPASGVARDFSAPLTSPVTYTVTAEAGNTQIWTITCTVLSSIYAYQVEHYWQNVTGDGYTLHETKTYSDTLGTSKIADPQTYTGFTQNALHPDRIASGTVSDTSPLTMKLYYDRELYDIQFEENGGSTVADITGLRLESQPSAPAAPTREDYVFFGWYRDSMLTQPFVFGEPIYQSHTLYAKWRYDYSNVNYLLPDGTTLYTASYKNGTIFERPADPVQTGKTLMGWYLEQGLVTPYNFDQALTSDRTLYAHYQNSGRELLSFYVQGQTGEAVINSLEHRIVFHMPYGSAVTGLSPMITVSADAEVSPASGQTMDFTDPVTYTVTSESNVSQTWTVTCVVDQNTEAAITGFTVPGQVGEALIDTVFHSVEFSVPYSADRSAMTPTVTVSTGATVLPVSQSAVDFSSLQPIYYRVTAPYGNYQDWRIVCRVLPNTQNGIAGFTADSQIGSSQIDPAAHTIEFRMPYGMDLSGLKPVIALDDRATIQPASGQAVDFRSPVQYTVTAENGASQVWTVRCIQKNTANDITAFVIPNQYGSTSIDTGNHNIHFYLNQGTSATALAPVISVSEGADIYPDSGAVRDFTGTITYLVTAEDGTPQVWTVTYATHYTTSILTPVEETDTEDNKPEDNQDKLEEAVYASETAQVEVSTGTAVVKGSDSATLTGTIVTGGGSQLQVGFRYRTATDERWSYTSVQSAVLANGQSFTANITGLKPGTAYLFEARASNSNGLNNGGSSSFTTQKAELPVVVTNTATSRSLSGMLMSGTVSKDGGDLLQDAGFQWGDSEGSLKKVSLGKMKELSYEIKNLVIGKTYYYQAYATNSAGTSYGKLLTYTIPGLAVTTMEAIEIKENSAILQARITGSDKILECGFTISPGKQSMIVAKADEKGYFKVTVKDLIPGKAYYFTAYAKTEKKTFYGKSRKLTPLNSFPKIDTAEEVEVGQIWAQLGGLIHTVDEEEDSNNNEDSKISTNNENNTIENPEEDSSDIKEDPILECGFYWGDTPDLGMQVIIEPKDKITKLTYKLVGLQAGTTYYYQAYAMNKKGTGYGETVSFTTAEATKPVVTTRYAGYDMDKQQWILTGVVGNKGGISLLEYGFQISRDAVEWTLLPIGFDTAGNFVARNLPFISQLEPGTYYVRAYVMNMIGTGEGVSIPFVIPKLPTVEAGVAPESPAPGTYILKGNITDTGAEGVYCYTTRFLYRKKGDKDWNTVGEATGKFGVTEFSYELKGLALGATYEFRTEAANYMGYSSSQTVEFVVDYGKDGQQAAEYLKQSGATPVEIANVLKGKFSFAIEATAQLLLQCGYTDSEMAVALKASEYKPNFRDAARIFAALGFSAATTAKLLYSHYEDMRYTIYAEDYELAKVLMNNQYSLVDNARAVAAIYKYDIPKLVTQYTSYGFYERLEVHKAVKEIYGQEALIQYLYTQSLYYIKRWNTSLTQIQEDFILTLREVCGMDAIAVSDKLMVYYPQLKMEQIAKLYSYQKYSVSDTISVLSHLYGAQDLEMARVMNAASYKPEDIVRYLIESADYTPARIVALITAVFRNWGDPKMRCVQVLRNYYNLGAVEAAKAMYEAGWTEAVDDSYGYGLGQLLTAMSMYYNQQSDYSQMVIMKELGQSPYTIALRIGGRAGWLTDYKELGYTASDVAVYYKDNPRDRNWTLSSKIQTMVRESDKVGYELSDIAFALRTIYNLDINTSLNYLKDNTTKTTKQINEVLKVAYGENPMLQALRSLSGQPIKKIACSLRYTYHITSPEEAAEYLLAFGYTSGAILEGIWEIYFNRRTAAVFDEFLTYARKALPEASFADALNALIYQGGNKPEPWSVISSLQVLGYDLKAIARILKEEYKYPLHAALGGMQSQIGRAREAEYTVITLGAYQLNTTSYVEYEKMRGTRGEDCAKLLADIFGIKDASEAADLLMKGGYGKEDVSTALLKVFFENRLTAQSAAQIDDIIKLSFPEAVDNNIRKLLQEGQLNPVSKAIEVLHKSGYSLEETIKSLKAVYGMSDARIIEELDATHQFGSDEVSIAAQGVLGNNYLIFRIRQWKGEAWGNAEGIWRNLRDQLGIVDQAAIFRYLRYAGFTEAETVKAADRILWEGIVPVMKSVYGVKSALEMGELLGRVGKDGAVRLVPSRFADQLKALYPGTTSYDIVKAFQAYGYPMTSNTYSIEGWMRTYACDGIHDDKLAAILGKNNNGLNSPVWLAAEILQGKGYVVQDAVFWLKTCGYTWEEFYKELVHRYAPSNYPTSYYENNSASKFIVQYLKEYYDIKDIARGEYSYWNRSSGVLADLISGGYTLEQAVYATLWLGKSAASNMVIALVDNSISRANAAHNQSLRLNAVTAAGMVFDVSLAVAYDKMQVGIKDINFIGLQDIAAGLMKYGPSGGVVYFSNWEILAAMQTVTEKYNALTNSGLPTRELALATLRLAGASASDAAAMLAAHRVGLSTASIVKSVFGIGSDWFDAVTAMAGAGYSFTDSISAVYNNSSYKTVIGVGILGTLTSSAIGALSSSAQLGNYITLVKEGAKLGFKIGQGTITLDDVMKYNLGYLQYKYGKIIYDYVPSDYKP